ncbi:Holliday junction resolvase RuvX [Candidatus Saccharibacteria bacterium]|nr:Holliday junction resolvase RuvX [Candidatus Saccharibacteria bacterium]
MAQTNTVLGLDIGAARIGVAIADISSVRIAVPLGAVMVDGNEYTELAEIVRSHAVSKIVVGYPRNQSGEATAQSTYVENVATQLQNLCDTIEFQDESLTSVVAEKRLQERGGAYEKQDIDIEAATIILQDYLERQP